MPGKQVKCPTCGAPNNLLNPGVLMISCEYCTAAFYWDKERIQAAGFKSALPEGFSRMYKGATGSLRNSRFIVLGRARYSFQRGFWDEWYLEMQNGELLWLTEDNHEFRLEKEVKSLVVPPFEKCGTGMRIDAGTGVFIVTEFGDAQCIGIEGELPRVVLPDQKYPYVDAATPDGDRSLGIEYTSDPPITYVGEWLNHTVIKMDDEGGEF
jgi:hypothetical protein